MRLTRRSLSLALSLGVLGGALLVLSFVFLTPGKYLLVPYSAMVILITAIVRSERIAQFGERFLVGLTAFTIASIGLYVAVAVTANGAAIGVLGHAWRLAFVFAVGAAVNLPAARLAHVTARTQAA